MVDAKLRFWWRGVNILFQTSVSIKTAEIWRNQENNWPKTKIFIREGRKKAELEGRKKAF